MRLLIMTAALCGAMASSALAQDLPAQTGPQNAVVKPITQNNADKPVAGANSFTAGQAQDMIRAKGYTYIGKLTQDSSGVWRGRAGKHGHRAHMISVDYQGNVN